MTNFVLMLTRDDVTVPDAHAILELALSAGTEHIGVKDIGLPRDEMAALVDTIHAAGRQAHLEVVSLTEGAERHSLQLGRELGFDYVVGGTRCSSAPSCLPARASATSPTPAPSSVTRAPLMGPQNRFWPTSRPCGSPSPASTCWPIATSGWTVTRSYNLRHSPIRSSSRGLLRAWIGSGSFATSAPGDSRSAPPCSTDASSPAPTSPLNCALSWMQPAKWMPDMTDNQPVLDTLQPADVVRRVDAKSFMEGPEHCREYLRNEHLWFGTSVVPVGTTGAVDPGHEHSWEVFYCAAGSAVVTTGATAFELEAGDALRIPRCPTPDQQRR